MPNIKDYLKDIIRMADWLEKNRGDLIKDRSSFDNQFQVEMAKGEDLRGFLEQLADKTFEKYRQDNPEVSPERLQSRAGGISRFRQPRPQAGAVSLPKREFGRSKGRVVKINRTDTVVVKGKQQIRNRDSKGRFVSIR